MEDPIFNTPRTELQKPGFKKLSLSELVAQRKPYWITPTGEIVDLAARGKDHALSALKIVRDLRAAASGPAQAIEDVINQGYLRVQVYPDSTAYVQGTYEALVQRGDRILEIVPGLRSVEIAYVPADYKAPPSLTRQQLDEMGWQEAVAYAQRMGRFGKLARKLGQGG